MCYNQVVESVGRFSFATKQPLFTERPVSRQDQENVDGGFLDGIMDEKKCTKCGEIKPISEYYKRPNGFLGVRNDCKSCHNEKSRQWYRNNVDYALELSSEWRKNHIEYCCDWRADYYRKNLKKIKSQNQK